MWGSSAGASDQIFKDILNFSSPTLPSTNLELFDDPEYWNNQLEHSIGQIGESSSNEMSERLRRPSISDLLDVVNTSDGLLLPSHSSCGAGGVEHTQLSLAKSSVNVIDPDCIDSGFSESPQYSPSSSSNEDMFCPAPKIDQHDYAKNCKQAKISRVPYTQQKESENQECVSAGSARKAKVSDNIPVTSLLTSEKDAVIMVLGEDKTVQCISISREKLEQFIASSNSSQPRDDHSTVASIDVPFTAENITVETSSRSSNKTKRTSRENNRPSIAHLKKIRNENDHRSGETSTKAAKVERRGRKRLHEPDSSDLVRGIGKRVRNNEACRKFRESRKVCLKNLFQQESVLLQNNLNLKEQVAMLKRQIAHIKQKMESSK